MPPKPGSARALPRAASPPTARGHAPRKSTSQPLLKQRAREHSAPSDAAGSSPGAQERFAPTALFARPDPKLRGRRGCERPERGPVTARLSQLSAPARRAAQPASRAALPCSHRIAAARRDPTGSAPGGAGRGAAPLAVPAARSSRPPKVPSQTPPGLGRRAELRPPCRSSRGRPARLAQVRAHAARLRSFSPTRSLFGSNARRRRPARPALRRRAQGKPGAAPARSGAPSGPAAQRRPAIQPRCCGGPEPAPIQPAPLCARGRLPSQSSAAGRAAWPRRPRAAPAAGSAALG